ncbi:MAG: Flp family type IVb pilin [Beijerinckiaceae bacterium]|nr:Flp family type IVb pilin [Beijerinckiaceae bacterium]
MQAHLTAFWGDESGVTAIEYGLILSLMTIACIAAFMALGAGSDGMWLKLQTKAGGALR